MRLSAPQKIAIAILTLLQLVGFVLLIVALIANVIPAMASGDQQQMTDSIISGFTGWMFWAFLLSVLSILVLVFYLIHAGTNHRLDTGMKAVWVILMLIFGVFVQVVYFLVEILPSRGNASVLRQKDTYLKA